MTETSRRALLRTGAAALALAPFASARAAVAGAGPTDLYTRARFRRVLRSSFRLVGPTGSWRVRLTRVGDLPPAARGDRHHFILTFRSSVTGPPQGSYVLRRSGFTATKLFVVPSDARRRTYQAVVNRAP